jgi:hypothetical protein
VSEGPEPHSATPPVLRDDVRSTLWSSESFFPVLVLALVSTVSFPITDRFRWGFLITLPILAATILLAFHRSDVRRKTLRVATALTVVAFLGAMAAQTAGAAPDSRPSGVVSSLLLAVLLFFSLPVITRRAFAQRRVNLNTLAAAVTAYLLIGLFFATTYRFLSAVQDAAFFGGEMAGQNEAGDFHYFSFITLTTTGFGDFVPATDAGRAVAILEALTGQVFLVTAVARVVSLLGQDRRLPRPDDAAPSTDQSQ